MSKQKILFCLANSTISGGNIMLLELASRLSDRGYDTMVYFADRSTAPGWFSGPLSVSSAANIESACTQSYDIVAFSNAFLVPLALPFISTARPLLICQSYESHCYGDTKDELFEEIDAFTKVLRLPISLVSISRSVQGIILQRTGRSSFFVPAAIDHELFQPQSPRDFNCTTKRILFVGDHSWALKGFDDLCQSLKLLAPEINLELVLITQQKRGIGSLDRFPFPLEVHVRPEREKIPAIIASCDVYCCASWYEGFGLPSVEAMAVGVPVVSTANLGVTDFGRDEVDMLIAEAGNPQSLADKLSRALTTCGTVELLRQNGFQTAAKYTWQSTLDHFTQALDSIMKSPRPSISAAELEPLLKELELTGLYVPQEMLDDLRGISVRFEHLCRRLMDQGRSDELIQELISIKAELHSHTNDLDSPCYKEFKGRFDLCNLLLSVWQDDAFDTYVMTVLQRLPRSAGAKSQAVI